MQKNLTQTAALTALAMLAFAANSLLCRQALGHDLIDAASFATLRTLAGAITLTLILSLRGQLNLVAQTGWRGAAALFTYMVFFSFAYLSLSAGTGALLLFGAVQLTMFAVALRGGERFSAPSWVGSALAIAGLVYLVAPGLSAPDPLGAVLMIAAGIAWGAYSLLGRTAADPLAATAGAFIRALPAIVAVNIAAAFVHGSSIQLSGALLATASGALASGVGYAIWYTAIRGLTATQAAIVQLSVPVIAAFGGVLFLAEDVTPRLIVASLATLGGVTIVLAQRARKPAA